MTDKERKVIDREPTGEMLDTAYVMRNLGERDMRLIWLAMFDRAPVLATAPAEPPKDGEVAALIAEFKSGCSLGTWGVRACDALARLSAPVPALTEEQIVAIRDEHLPSQGEAFDCIAFARAVLAAPVPAREWIPTEAKTPDDMLARDGLYAVGDTKAPNALVPIIVRNGDAYAVKLEAVPLCKWGWLETVVIYGGFVRSPPAVDK